MTGWIVLFVCLRLPVWEKGRPIEARAGTAASPERVGPARTLLPAAPLAATERCMTRDDQERDTSFLYGFARRGDTDALVARLRDADAPIVRRRAAELLGDFDDLPQQTEQHEVREGLIATVLEDDDDSVRARAIDALYRHGRGSLERLVERLADDDVTGRPDWVTADLLVSWLDAEYPEFRLVAAATLGEFGDESTLPELLESLEDPDPRVRSRAVRSVGRLGDDRCVPSLRARLTDADASVRQAAVTALASVGTDRALESLLPVVTGAETATVRWMAADELGALATEGAVETLLEALADESRAVVRAALLSLLDQVVSAPDGRTPELRERVADRLREREVRSTVPQLVEILQESPRPERRVHAVWLLGVAVSDYDETALECLLDALDSDHEPVATAAQTALEQLDDPAVRDRLRVFRERGEASRDALDRAEEVLETFGEDSTGEVVTNSVDITYVRDPADYTASRREDEE